MASGFATYFQMKKPPQSTSDNHLHVDDPRPPLRVLTSMRGSRAREPPTPLSILTGIWTGFRYILSPIAGVLVWIVLVASGRRIGRAKPHDERRSHIEFLHRYNVLYSRAQLLRHFEDKRDLLDADVSKAILDDLTRHSNAVRDYRSFRAEESLIFSTVRSLDEVIEQMAALDVAEAQAALLPQESDEAQKAKVETEEKRKSMTSAFLDVLRSTTSGMSTDKRAKDSQALWARLTMALGGGLALIAPMLIMVLHPTKLTTILTTSCFVVAVAVALAVFMDDSQPKDVVACTAAYAAVLVVFIGAGGGTGGP